MGKVARAPLLDRIDLHVELPRVEYDKLSADGLAEPSLASFPIRTTRTQAAALV